MRKRLLLSMFFGALVCSQTALTQVTLTVQTDQPGAAINPAMWGVFFEDINFGADGGLYAELVKNRSFEFPDALMGWHEVKLSALSGSLLVHDQDPAIPANSHYLRVTADQPGGFGVSNEGFRGIGVKAGETYLFSAQVRKVLGDGVKVRVELVTADGRVLAQDQLTGLKPRWAKETATLKPVATEAKAVLRVVVDGQGTVDFDMVSLFPKKTGWLARGSRADAGRPEAWLCPVPRRLHRRRAGSHQPLSVETDAG
jgi:hypothetical protein